MQLGYRGSVNSWECDENNHLNVRFYVQKHWQTLCGGAPMLGLSPAREPHELAQSLSVQHIRFLQESRLAAPLSGYFAIVNVRDDSVDVLTELRQSFTDEPVSTCVHRLAGMRGNPDADLPEHARPRGLPDEDLPHSVLPLTGADDYGFEVIGRGVVGGDECDSNGMLLVHNYMARLSDSMPHLWGLLRAQAGELDEDEGGAVLEYRLRYHRPLQRGQRFVITSGLREASAKVQRFAHLMFNADDGAICVSAEAVGVRMDLIARKAKVLTQQMQTHMRSRLLRSYTP